ncbi:MAG TPA: protein kinase [Gemmatimonadaceae bacterium]|nr:protein kinase [Gemmatimonadaceae bacterium]
MTDIRANLQQTLGSAYTLERELGGGGMSRTYVAEETALRRRVVVKVLSPDLAVGVSVDRFKREIQLAAALQHPHIVPVLSAGDSNGLPYYTMPYVDGESLRARLARGALSIGEAIGILRDVARALAFAHAHGVVHRDIKPDNVLLSGGSATVADFGIAKAITAARTGGTQGATLTQLGTALGTPAYMAPEQAAGDPGTDHRADLYAYGVMAYEMLAGHAPFHGLTPQRLLAAHMSETPRSVSELRADIPPALAELVMRCLEKEAARRPQSAADIARYLDSINSSESTSAAVLLGRRVSLVRALALYAGAFVIVAVLARAAIVGIGLPDWVFPAALVVMALGLPVILVTALVQHLSRRALTATPTLTPGGSPAGQGTLMTMALKASPHVSWRRAAWGGGIAVGALVLLIGAWMAMRVLGIGPAASLIASGALDERERVILAEFRSPATDSLLGPTVTEAFRTDLGQSSSLVVMPASNVRSVLQRMQRSASVRVDYAVAREVATREGIKAVIDGDVVELGGSYVLSARLVSAQTGDELAAFRETASDERDIIPAISRLSKQVRTKVGESLRRVQSARTLDKVTTPSLEALQRFVAANRAIEVDGDFARFEELMSQAISLDTGFAMAHRKLAIELSNRGIQRPRVEALLQKAFDNVDRLSETERFVMLGSYYTYGPAPDEGKAVAAYESLLEIDPTNVIALNNVAPFYHNRGENAKAEEMARRAISVQPTASVFYNNLVHNLVHQGKFAAADSAVALASANLPRNPEPVFLRTELALERMQLDTIARLVDSLMKARAADVPTQATGNFELAALRQLTGRLAESARHLAQARRLARSLGNLQASVNAVLDSADTDSWFRNERERSLRTIERAVTLPVFDSIRPAQRPYARLVDLYARAGRPERAATMLREFESLPVAQTPDGQRTVHRLRGTVARTEGRHDEAIREFRAAIGGGCVECGYPDLAFAFDAAGNADSAIVYLSRFAEARAIALGIRAPWLPVVHKRLGELHDGKGNVQLAASHYAQFIELWKNADAELQPQVQRARTRLQELERRRG